MSDILTAFCEYLFLRIQYLGRKCGYLFLRIRYFRVYLNLRFRYFLQKKCTFTSVNLDFLSETCVNQNQKGIKELIRSVLKYIFQNKSILGITRRNDTNFAFFIKFCGLLFLRIANIATFCGYLFLRIWQKFAKIYTRKILYQ